MSPDLPMNDSASEDNAFDQLEPEQGQALVTITLLKQYTYCPRVVYYETCTPGIRPTTYKMQAGQDAHERERLRAARRKLSAYQLTEGERQFDIRVSSAKLGLSGLIDEVVLNPQEAIVVDYKLAGWVGDNHLIQVAAYALLVEETFHLPVKRAFIYLMKPRQFEMVAIDDELRNSVLQTLEAIQYIRLFEYMPPPVDQPNKCSSCEFRRFCNDV